MVRVFSVSLVIGAFASIPAALLQRDLRYREITIVDVVGTVSAAVIGVSVAWLLRNAWALVLMELARRTIRLVMFAAIARWRPSFVSSWSETRELSRFNSLNMATKAFQAMEAAASRGGGIGMILGASALGMYNMSSRLLEQAKSVFVTPLAAVALPLASQTQHDFPTLHRAIEGTIGLASLVAFPTFIGSAVVAPLAIPLVFGDQCELVPENWTGC